MRSCHSLLSTPRVTLPLTQPTSPCTPVPWGRGMHALQPSPSPLPRIPRLPAPPHAPVRRVRGRGRRVSLIGKLFKALLKRLVRRLLGGQVRRWRVRRERRLWRSIMKERVVGIRPAHRVLVKRGFQRLLRVLAHGMAPPVRARTFAG
jgi:hypothetical protein